jgi:penicillin-binding protein 1C
MRTAIRKITSSFTRKRLKRAGIIMIGTLLLFLLLDFFFPFRADIHFSTIIQSKEGETLYAFLGDDDHWRLPMEEQEITPELRRAFLTKEDKWFNYHFGVNPFAIVRAAFNNITRAKRTSGASTITMQVVRLLHPARRTYLNKLLEMFRAMQLEWHYSKKEIFRMYVNLVPYGGNVVGVKSASLLYFQKNPDHLSLAQVTTLCIIPNRPNSLKPGRYNNEIKTERNRWLHYFSTHKVFGQDIIADAMDEPLEMKRNMAPKIAPHYALWLRRQFPGQPIIKTFVELNRQQSLESLCKNYMQRMHPRNIHNAAVVVLNNRTGKVEAYLGSSDFDDAQHDGQVNGVTANRSPGSTLKPLIYAMAFDAGLLTPKTVVTDVPVNFNGYAPENYFKIFNGTITIEKALENSLNVPAVKTLNDVGVLNFTQKLTLAKFKWISKHQSQLGLSSALGGCGVTLLELTNLYRTIANKGVWSDMQFIQDQPVDTHKVQLISDASAYMLTSVLCKLTRPDLPQHYENTLRVKIAWKTGTSFGRKDAWSIGFNKKYTVGVWVGNFNGAGVPDLSGSDIATPLLFDIFNNIDYYNQTEWFMAPSSIDYRLVCSESGNIPSAFCTGTIIDMFLPNISRTNHCEHLKEVYVSADASVSYCTYCRPENGYIKKLYPNYSAELIDYYNTRHIQYQNIPAHNPGCERIFKEFAPKITFPVNGMQYLIDRYSDDKMQLTCEAHNDVKQVYWYLNDIFYKKATPAEQVFFKPDPGNYKISCTDDKGRTAHVRIDVRW